MDRGAHRHATAFWKTPRFGAAPAVSAASAVGRRHGQRGGGRAPTTIGARGRGDTGRRTDSCPPRPTQPAAPAQRSGGEAPHATAARSGPHTEALAARHPHGRTTLGLRDRPTLGLTCAAGGCVKRDERRHATRMKNAPSLGPRQRRQVQAMLGRELTRMHQVEL